MRASTRRARGTVLVAVLALSLVLTPPVWVVLAAPVTLPQTLNGGGPGGSEWDIENDTDDGFQVAEGTLLGPPQSGRCL